MLPIVARWFPLLLALPEAALALAGRWVSAFEAARLDMPEAIAPEDMPPPFY